MREGLLLVNKNSGMTSHDLVLKIRKILKQKSVGHCGTLDPMAEGLMLFLLGKACKLSRYLSMMDKTYELELIFGIITDTGDLEGEILKKKAVSFDEKLICETLLKLKGRMILPVPAFSAVKVKGKKLYQYAREKKPVPPVKREMFFYDPHILNMKKDRAHLRISCRKGGYIRSWVSLAGEELGAGASLSHLKRLSIPPYHLDQALTLEELGHGALLDESPGFIPFCECLPHLPQLQMSPELSRSFSNGRLPPSSFFEEDQKKVDQTGQARLLKMMRDQSFAGLVEVRPSENPRILNVFTA